LRSTSFAFPVLVADIGGASARFALKERPAAELCAPAHVRTGDYPGLAEAIETILPKFAVRPKSLIACGAGAIRRAAHLKRTFRLKPTHENENNEDDQDDADDANTAVPIAVSISAEATAKATQQENY
jgi:hypothetical protein